jgi:DHA2 family multidrug resistance protein
MRSQLTTQADYMSVAIPMFVLGAGIPACIICLMSLGVSDLPDDKVTNGAGLQNFLRIMSSAVESPLTQTYWEHMAKFNRAELVGAMNPSNLDAFAERVRGNCSVRRLQQSPSSLARWTPKP